MLKRKPTRNTLHRRHVDEVLQDLAFNGKVLDVGGRKKKKHGEFEPNLDAVDGWVYLNIDSATEPDILASADEIPVDDNSFDSALLSEVLEHLKEPEASLQEIARVLKPGGTVFITVPFLFPLHACPHDYQRWTPDKLQLVLTRCGFKDVTITPLSGYVAVIADLLWAYVAKARSRASIIGRAFGGIYTRLMLLFHDVLFRWDKRVKLKDGFTTGYLVVARK